MPAVLWEFGIFLPGLPAGRRVSSTDTLRTIRDHAISAALPGGARSLRVCGMSDAPPSGSKPARVDEFDGMRGLLALWVALSHLLAWTGFWENPLPGRLAGPWETLVSATPAVDTFIILSGFAISFLLHHRRQSYLAFMRGRCLRIYPVYLTCLAFAIGTSFLVPTILKTASWNGTIYFEWIGALAEQESSAFGSHVFWHLTLLNGLVPKSMLPGATGTLLTPAWSITLEWQYYLIAPLLARGVRSSLGLLAIGWIAWLGMHHSAPWQNPQLSFLPAQLPLFLIGIASYHLYAARSGPGGFRHLPSVACAGLLIIALLGGWHPVALILWAAGFGCVIIRGSDPLARLLGMLRHALLHPLLQHLGRISFPLYLVHWPVITLVLFAMLRVKPDLSGPAALAILTAITLPCMLAAAELIHRLIEKPTMSLGRKRNPS